MRGRIEVVGILAVVLMGLTAWVFTGAPGIGGAAPHPGLGPQVGAGSFPIDGAAGQTAGRSSPGRDQGTTAPYLSGSAFQVFRNISVGVGPAAVVYDPQDQEVFVANSGSDNVSAISLSTDTVVASVPVGRAPVALTYDAPLREVLVANSGSGNVSVISLSDDRVVATIPVGTGPDALADDGHGQAFAANRGSNTVSVISLSTDSAVSSFPVGSEPDAMVCNSTAGEVFVANLGSNGLSKYTIAAGMVAGPFPVGANPEALALGSGGIVFVADAGSNSLAAWSSITDTSSPTPPVGTRPDALAYDGATQDLFVANGGSDNVSVLSTADGFRVAAAVPVGDTPDGLVSVGGEGQVFVANAASDSVSILARVYPITFTETGLPAGTSWTVSLVGADTPPGGVLRSSTSRVVRYEEPNGSYYYTVGDVRGRVAVPSPGSLSVAGAAVPVSVTFLPVYPVTFTESGLPLGAWWYVNVSGEPSLSGMTSSPFSNSLNYTLPNGSYSYRVGTTAKEWVALKDSFAVDGQALDLPVTFYAQTYFLTFTETGLPPKVLESKGWTVVLSGVPLRTTLDALSVGATNGTFPVLIEGPSGFVTSPSGTVSVRGTTNVTVSFVKGKAVTLTFAEKGVSSGRSWCASVNDYVQCSSTSKRLKFGDLAEGTYSYAMVEPTQNATMRLGKTAVPLSGTLDVSRSEKLSLAYLYTYGVKFTETGLASGTWAVTVKGSTETAPAGTAIHFSLPNGTYAFRVGKETGFTCVGSPKPFVVNGAATPVTVTFTAKTVYQLLPPGFSLGIAGPVPLLVGMGLTPRRRV